MMNKYRKSFFFLNVGMGKSKKRDREDKFILSHSV